MPGGGVAGPMTGGTTPGATGPPAGLGLPKDLPGMPGTVPGYATPPNATDESSGPAFPGMPAGLPGMPGGDKSTGSGGFPGMPGGGGGGIPGMGSLSPAGEAKGPGASPDKSASTMPGASFIPGGMPGGGVAGPMTGGTTPGATGPPAGLGLPKDLPGMRPSPDAPTPASKVSPATEPAGAVKDGDAASAAVDDTSGDGDEAAGDALLVLAAAQASSLTPGSSGDSPWSKFMPGGAGGGPAGTPAAAGGAGAADGSGGSPWSKWMPGGSGASSGAGGSDAKAPPGPGGGSEASSSSPWSKWMPASAGGGGGPPGGGAMPGNGASGASAYMPGGKGGAGAMGMPTGSGGFTPFKPPSAPKRDLAPHANGTWRDPEDGTNTTVNLDFVVVNEFMGGFMGSVAVSPWTPGAIVVLNFTGTDVAIQRLFNGDIIDKYGEPVKAFDLLRGAEDEPQLYIVKLHDVSVPSSYGSPDNSFSFMADGTPQAPELMVGCAWLAPDALQTSGDVLRYRGSGFPIPGGFVGSVEVSPWKPGAEVELDFGKTGVQLSADKLWNAKIVDVPRRGAYRLRLTNFSKEADEYVPDSSLVFKATGPKDVRPILTRVSGFGNSDDDDDDDAQLPILAQAARALGAPPGAGAAVACAVALGVVAAAVGAMAWGGRAGGTLSSLRSRLRRQRLASSPEGASLAQGMLLSEEDDTAKLSLPYAPYGKRAYLQV